MNKIKPLQGRFITFEGIDGAGKSSQVSALVLFLQLKGIAVEHTREPGGCTLGEQLRELVLHQEMHPDTETLLLFASRRQHLDERIYPALQARKWVVCERFSDSTYAYQVGGRSLPAERFYALEQWVHPRFSPDLTFLFDIDPAEAFRRLQAAETYEKDRFESLPIEFFEMVREAYLERARIEHQRIHVIDGSKSAEEIRKEIQAVVTERWFT